MNKRNVAELMFGYAPRNILGLTNPHSAPFHDNRGIGNQCIDLNEQARIVGALVKKQLRDKRYNRGPDLAATLCYLANGEQYITEAAAQMIYEAFEPPLDEELRELLFDVIRNDNTRSSESVGFREADTNDSKIINWRLMAKMLDHNRLQFWEGPFKHDGIEDTPCIEKILEETGLSGGCNVEKIWTIAKQFDGKKMVMGTATYDDERVTLEGVRQALNQYNCQQIEAKVAEKYKSCYITMPEENNEELLI
ncbi:unnamed protein product [Hydatigera taeniaeformis]|uniref:FRG domain-containing protein n=1 Tax=Hydatigena taeniaeformis TaxID=6205 RepID=A0A0R3XA41_HYDTA|nr:unnamed protein product [Hydatigera taeniaeformis]